MAIKCQFGNGNIKLLISNNTAMNCDEWNKIIKAYKMGNEASVLRLELANRDSQTTCWTQVHIPDVGNQMGEHGDGLTQI